MIKLNTPYACMHKLINIIEINLRGAHGAPYIQGCNLKIDSRLRVKGNFFK